MSRRIFRYICFAASGLFLAVFVSFCNFEVRLGTYRPKLPQAENGFVYAVRANKAIHYVSAVESTALSLIETAALLSLALVALLYVLAKRGEPRHLNVGPSYLRASEQFSSGEVLVQIGSAAASIAVIYFDGLSIAQAFVDHGIVLNLYH